MVGMSTFYINECHGGMNVLTSKYLRDFHVLTCYEELKARNICGSLFLIKCLYLDAIWQNL